VKFSGIKAFLRLMPKRCDDSPGMIAMPTDIPDFYKRIEKKPQSKNGAIHSF